MEICFHGDYSLTAIGKAFSTPKATVLTLMFYGCSSITSLNLNNVNTSLVTAGNMNRMLEGLANCNSISFGSNFRFKKTDNSTIQILGTDNYYWKKDTTVKTSNGLENTTDVSGTWKRQHLIVFYQGNGTSTSGSTEIGRQYIDAKTSASLSTYSSTDRSCSTRMEFLWMEYYE